MYSSKQYLSKAAEASSSAASVEQFHQSRFEVVEIQFDQREPLNEILLQKSIWNQISNNGQIWFGLKQQMSFLLLSRLSINQSEHNLVVERRHLGWQTEERLSQFYDYFMTKTRNKSRWVKNSIKLLLFLLCVD